MKTMFFLSKIDQHEYVRAEWEDINGLYTHAPVISVRKVLFYRCCFSLRVLYATVTNLNFQLHGSGAQSVLLAIHPNEGRYILP